MTTHKIHVQSGIEIGMNVAFSYGTDNELYALAQRIMDVHPDADLMGADGCLYMAQTAVATGARALPAELGEIQAWRDKKTNELIFMLGYQYHVRMMEQKGGGFWWPQPREMTAAERKSYKVGGEDLGFVCRLIRTHDLQQMSQLGLPTVDIIDNMAYMGTAVVTAEEMILDKPPKGRTWAWVCERRSQKDAMSKAFGTYIKPVHAAEQPDLPEARPVETAISPMSEMTLDELNDEMFG